MRPLHMCEQHVSMLIGYNMCSAHLTSTWATMWNNCILNNHDMMKLVHHNSSEILIDVKTKTTTATAAAQNCYTKNREKNETMELHEAMLCGVGYMRVWCVCQWTEFSLENQ